MAKELGGNDYDDLTGEVPSEDQWHRAADPEQEQQRSKRLRVPAQPTSVPVVTESSRTSKTSGPESSSARNRTRGVEELLDQSMEESFASGPHWSQEVHQSFFTKGEGDFWNQPTAMVAVEIDMPEARTNQKKPCETSRPALQGP